MWRRRKRLGVVTTRRRKMKSNRVRLLGSMEGSLCLVLEVPMRLLRSTMLRGEMLRVILRYRVRLARSTTPSLGLQSSMVVEFRVWKCTVLQV